MLKSLVFVLMFLFFTVDIAFSTQPFPYDLHLSYTPGASNKVMIVAHGMGSNYRIEDTIKIDKTLVSFNFPDYDFNLRAVNLEQTTFGTIKELLPLIYVIKKCVLVDGHQEVDLYGFSAGGGAIINAIGVLNSTDYDKNLQEMGINQKEKEQLLQAIQQGLIILDTPLKSVGEIIAFRGPSPELNAFAKRYQANEMEPIDSIRKLKGLSLNIILHFQNPDEILSNRDDDLFYTQLKKYNKNGTTRLVIGKDNGHMIPHLSLWDFYKKQLILGTVTGKENG